MYMFDLKTQSVPRSKHSASVIRTDKLMLFVIYIRRAVGLFWVPGHAGVKGNEIADKHARGGFSQRLVGPVVGVSSQNIRRNN
jgi:ribonuclease HI